MIKGVVIRSTKLGMMIKTENGGNLSTKQTGIATGTPVQVAYNHDKGVIGHVWERDEDKVQDEYIDPDEDI